MPIYRSDDPPDLDVAEDEFCAQCYQELPESDPDPENTGASPWWEGFCSDKCRKKYNSHIRFTYAKKPGES